MKMIIASRRMGKTTQLIYESAAQHKYIVCRNRQRAMEIFKQAKDLKLDIPLPLTFDDFIGHSYYGKVISGFLIDEAQSLLQQMTDVPIETITMSIE